MTELLAPIDRMDFRLGERDRAPTKWSACSSDSSKYVDADLFDERSISRVSWELNHVTERSVAAVSLSSLSIIVFIASVFHTLFGEGSLSATSEPSAAGQVIADALGLFGLSTWLTGAPYALTLILSAVLVLLSELRATVTVRERTRTLARDLTTFRVVDRQARQIVIGAGTLSFHYGADGFWIDGGSVQFDAEWIALEG